MKRSSCGCVGFDYQTMSEKLGISNISHEDNITLMIKQIHDYLFGAYVKGDKIRKIKDDISVFVNLLCKMTTVDAFNANKKEVLVVFSHIISQPLFRYTKAELFSDLLLSLQHELRHSTTDTNLQLDLMDLFAIFYRELAIINWQVIHGQQEGIEQMSENNQRLAEISKTDQLTGLYNRWGFVESVQAITKKPMNYGKEIMVLYADMDNLKIINDKFGHDEGDFAIKEIASILKDAFRSTDIVARFGGNEFVAFALIGMKDYENVIKQRIHEITAAHNAEVNKPYPIQMSIGVCESFCTPSLDITDILDIADKRLYLEKKVKRENRKAFYSTPIEYDQ